MTKKRGVDRRVALMYSKNTVHSSDPAIVELGEMVPNLVAELEFAEMQLVDIKKVLTAFHRDYERLEDRLRILEWDTDKHRNKYSLAR